MTIPNIKSLDPGTDECETPKSQETVQLIMGRNWDFFWGGLAEWNHIFMLGDSYLLELELDITCSKIVPCRNWDFSVGRWTTQSWPHKIQTTSWDVLVGHVRSRISTYLQLLSLSTTGPHWVMDWLCIWILFVEHTYIYTFIYRYMCLFLYIYIVSIYIYIYITCNNTYPFVYLKAFFEISENLRSSLDIFTISEILGKQTSFLDV